MVTQPVCRPKYMLEQHSSAPTPRPITSARMVSWLPGPPKGRPIQAAAGMLLREGRQLLAR
jgi:hypothetical protein